MESVVASRRDLAVTAVGIGAGFGLLGWAAIFLLAAAVFLLDTAVLVAVLVGLKAGNWITGDNIGFISGGIFELVAFEVVEAE